MQLNWIDEHILQRCFEHLEHQNSTGSIIHKKPTTTRRNKQKTKQHCKIYCGTDAAGL